MKINKSRLTEIVNEELTKIKEAYSRRRVKETLKNKELPPEGYHTCSEWNCDERVSGDYGDEEDRCNWCAEHDPDDYEDFYIDKETGEKVY